MQAVRRLGGMRKIFRISSDIRQVSRAISGTSARRRGSGSVDDRYRGLSPASSTKLPAPPSKYSQAQRAELELLDGLYSSSSAQVGREPQGGIIFDVVPKIKSAENAIAFASEVQDAKEKYSHLWSNQNGYPAHNGGLQNLSPAIQNIIKSEVSNPELWNYSAPLGDPTTKDLLARFFSTEFGLDLDLDNCVPVSSCKNALGMILDCFADSSDTMVHTSQGPNYPVVNYKQKSLPSKSTRYSVSDSKIDIQEVKGKIEQAPKHKQHIIYINSPHNPTGAVYTNLTELTEVLTILKNDGYSIKVVFDETYFFTQSKEVNVWRKDLSNEAQSFLKEASFMLVSGKWTGAPGLRLGSMVMPNDSGVQAKVKDWMIESHTHPDRLLARSFARAASDPLVGVVLEQNKQQLEQNVHVLHQQLQATLGINIPKPVGGVPFVYFDAQPLLEMVGYSCPVAFRNDVLKYTGISFNTNADFNGSEPGFRITCGVLNEQEINQMVSVLGDFVATKKMLKGRSATVIGGGPIGRSFQSKLKQQMPCNLFSNYLEGAEKAIPKGSSYYFLATQLGDTNKLQALFDAVTKDTESIYLLQNGLSFEVFTDAKNEYLKQNPEKKELLNNLNVYDVAMYLKIRQEEGVFIEEPGGRIGVASVSGLPIDDNIQEMFWRLLEVSSSVANNPIINKVEKTMLNIANLFALKQSINKKCLQPYGSVLSNPDLLKDLDTAVSEYFDFFETELKTAGIVNKEAAIQKVRQYLYEPGSEDPSQHIPTHVATHGSILCGEDKKYEDLWSFIEKVPDRFPVLNPYRALLTQ